MNRTRRITLTVIALALLAAAAVALWPLASGAGPAYGAASALPGAGIPVGAEPYHPQVSNAPTPQLARYWGTPAANSTYAYYETLGVELVFSEAVTVTGAPELELLIGATVKKAIYHEGSGTTTLRFQYRVADGDRDADGFSINGAAALKLGTGTIKSVATPSRAAYTTSLPITAWGIVQNDAGHKVHGNNLVPSFGSATVANQAYALNQLIPALDLPASTGGNGALTYSLNQTTGAPPCGTAGASGASGSSGPSGSSGNAIPTWMSYYAPGATYNGATVGGGGKIAPNGTNKPTAAMTPTCFELYAVDADGDNSAADRAVLSFSVAVLTDYDSNDNGLIEVSSLAQLDAIRYDLNGNGAADNTADNSKYATAFPNPAVGMGCLRDHDDDAATDKVAGCIGYELTQNLDFDTDGDGATYTTSSTGVVTGDAGDTYYNGGKGWTAISGGWTNGFTATFDGAGKTISNLFIKDTSAVHVGLFGNLGAGGRIKRLGVLDLSVTAAYEVGGLAGQNRAGAISDSYAIGTVTGSGAVNTVVGGLVGRNIAGAISNSYAAGSVTGNGHYVGGLVGIHETGGTISSSYSTGSVSGSINHVGGLVGGSSGTISGSYATGSVSGNDAVGGLVGLHGGTISGSYATGSVSGNNNVGGLVGYTTGAISASYATGAISGNIGAGGLVGANHTGAINVAYAAGPVTGNNHVGGLVGWTGDGGTTTNSYATGSVSGNVPVGGLAGWTARGGAVTNSYWDTRTTGQSTSGGGGAGGTGKTTRDLQSPAGYSGIYANWNANLDGIAGNDDPWDFGTARQYPVLKYGGLAPAQQRQTAIRSDNWNAPVVGEPVAAALDDAVAVATGTVSTWQWQSSANGSTWTDIAGATSAIYVPVAADAASGGKFLRAKVTFTASGQSQTLTTANTAKVIAASTAPSASTTAAIPIVGQKLRYAITGVTAANTASWWWQRCDNAAMTTNCKVRAQSNADSDAHTEYVPVAGSDTDVGKYLRAYAYYSDSGNSNAWTRTQTAVLGPVVAAPAPAPAPNPTPTPAPAP